jgi:membrane protease YdiL (CAAX protease family)
MNAPIVKRHPVLLFYALAFAISWAGIFLVIGGPGNFPGNPERVEKLFLPVMLAWLAGPSVASVVVTGLVDGRSGYRELLTRLTRWRIAGRWYAMALLTAPLVYLGTAFVLSLTSPGFVPGIVTTGDKAALLLMGLAYGLVGGGFLEELGWTGFAVPRLRQRHGAVGTALIVGFLWGAYHFSVIFWAAGGVSGALGLAVLFMQLFAWLPAYRVLMVWVYDRTESLLLAMLMHASLTAGMLILQPAAIMAGASLLTWLIAFASAWWLLVATVSIVVHGRLWGSPQPRASATV